MFRQLVNLAQTVMAVTAGLAKLRDVEQLTPLVTRILGQNPGPYTLQGTNTYLIGARGGTVILLDTAQGEPAYVPLLRQALQGHSSVSDIILSHYHHDHVLGLEQVLPLLGELGMPPPRIHKFPSKNASQDEPSVKLLEKVLSSSFVPNERVPVHPLQDGQIFNVTEGTQLEVLHTPGHTDDSASFVLRNASEDPILFTADTVLGQGTAVFTDLKALIGSLQRMIKAVSSSLSTVRLFCGHGPVVKEGIAKMQEYIDHRLQREQQVLAALNEAGSPQTAAQLVKTIYGPSLPEQLVQAATHGIILHLEKLEQERKVKRIEHDSPEAIQWELLM